jgi:hypothetical protein
MTVPKYGDFTFTLSARQNFGVRARGYDDE